MESFLVPASNEGDTDHRHGLTSFLSDEQPVTIANGHLLSAHTHIADFSELHCTTNTHILNNAKLPTLHTTTQPTALNMPAVQRSRRVKYTEAAFPAVHEQDHEQAQLASDPRPLHSHPHMIISTPPQASPPAITSERKDITQLLSTRQAPTPAKTAEAQKALNSDFSSSQPSDQQNTSPTIDSAIDMKDRNCRRHKRVSSDEEQELVFRGRCPGDTGNATTSSKRHDSDNGNLASEAVGEADRPVLAAKSTNQTTSNNSRKPDTTAKPYSNTTGQSSRRPELEKKQPIQESKPSPQKNSWDTGYPPLPGDARLNGGFSSKRNNHNGRVRLDSKPNKKPRESPWIKDSLIPKGDPKRHQVRWTSSSREGSPPNSNRTSSGWGTRRKREDGGAALGDWSGGMAPAVIDWDSRAPFKDRQTEVKIDNWLADVSSALTLVDPVSFTDGAKTFSFTTTASGERVLIPEEKGDVVPRYWIPTHLEGYTIAVFWNNHMSPDSSLELFDEGDLDQVKPWWQKYVNVSSCMLQEIDHPWIAGNDPDENKEERLAREFDTGGLTAGANRKAAEKAKREAERKRKLARVAKAHKFAGVPTSSAVSAMPNGIKPGLSHLFLRSAYQADMIPLRDIYNRYIDNTFVVPETSRRTEADMLNRLQAARDLKLPFIVACQRGEVVKARNKNRNGGEDMIMSDRVVGFAYAGDWVNEEESIYRTTVKMEVFVHMEHYGKNIGSCLVDKMMGLLDSSFIERGGYETVGDELDGIGASKVVSNVLIRYSYDAQNTEKLVWVSEWLNRRLGFKEVGDLQGVAQKFDKK